MNYKKVMCAIDFSDLSNYAFEYTLDLLKGQDTQIILIHVIEHLYYHDHFLILSLSPDEIEDKFTKLAKEKLTELTKNYTNDFSFKFIIREGHPQTEIVNASKKQDVDLIVIASHGHTGIAHVILGSIAERVVQNASCPVLIVKKTE